jgi:hypothetical protein
MASWFFRYLRMQGIAYHILGGGDKALNHISVDYYPLYEADRTWEAEGWAGE